MISICHSSDQTYNNIVFDCDPGTDDAMALKLLSVNGPCPDWCVSTFGNMPWKYVNKNLKVLIRLFGLRSQVTAGARTPYDGHTVSCGDFHGADGLADIADSLFDTLGMTQSDLDADRSLGDLADYICSRVEVTYIATGPLSSLSHLIMDYPETLDHINKLYVMGGGIHRFNKDGDREYNFAGDGIAVKNVFDSPLDITLFPLDITEVCAVLSVGDIESIDFSGQPFIRTFLMKNCQSNKKYDGLDGAVMHDCLPVLYMQHPEIFTIEDMSLVADPTGHIECSSSGRTVHVAVSCPKDLVLNSFRAAVRRHA